MSGAFVNWKTLSPSSNRLQIGSIPAPRWPRRSSAAGRRAALPGARHRGAAGVDARTCRTARWNRWPIRISTSPRRCAALECRIAPTHTGGIYYTGPSEDLSRPGRMWWSVPPGVETFRTWQETTTVFHEECRATTCRSAGRSVIRPAEPLAPDGLLGVGTRRGLGALRRAVDGRPRLASTTPATEWECWSAQRFRAARVVIDIGVHCGAHRASTAASGTPHGRGHSCSRTVRWPRRTCASSFDRYLGWPGQAPSYAIGQRLWQQLRDETLRRGVAAEGIPQPRTRSRRAAAGCPSVGAHRRCRSQLMPRLVTRLRQAALTLRGWYSSPRASRRRTCPHLRERAGQWFSTPPGRTFRGNQSVFGQVRFRRRPA